MALRGGKMTLPAQLVGVANGCQPRHAVLSPTWVLDNLLRHTLSADLSNFTPQISPPRPPPAPLRPSSSGRWHHCPPGLVRGFLMVQELALLSHPAPELTPSPSTSQPSLTTSSLPQATPAPLKGSPGLPSALHSPGSSQRGLSESYITSVPTAASKSSMPLQQE